MAYERPVPNALNVAEGINEGRVGSKDPNRIRWTGLIGGYALAFASIPVLFINIPAALAMGLSGSALAARELLRGSRLGGSDGEDVWNYAQRELGAAMDQEFASRRGQ